MAWRDTAGASGGRSSRAEQLALALVTAGVLLPFAGKAVHVDEPLFLWTARQILAYPLDFYGFSVNWYGHEQPISSVAKNPPGAAYYLALLMALVGEREWALRLGLLPAALAVTLGTHRLARRWCRSPLPAALAAALTPAFVVAGLGLMSDVLMLALWVWAVVLWVEGMEDGRSGRLGLAAILAAAAALVKFFGAALIPLLLVHGLLVRRGPRWWPLALLAPAAALGGYQVLTALRYGQGLLAEAGIYATWLRLTLGPGLTSHLVAGLTFTGGCLASVALFAPWLWSRRALAASAGVMGLATLLVPYLGTLNDFALLEAGEVRWATAAQIAVLGMAGLSVLALAMADVRARPSPESALLALWVVGTFLFTALLNWTVNARSLLPMAPAAGILLARRLEGLGVGARSRWPLLVPLLPGAVVALLVAAADRAQADAARTAAALIMERVAPKAKTLWFQGHWGFQYYMQAAGARPLDIQRSYLFPGDGVVVPLQASNLRAMPVAAVAPWGMLEVPQAGYLVTMSNLVGAGFHSDWWGPLPFAIAPVPPDRYRIWWIRAATWPRELPPPPGHGPRR